MRHIDHADHDEGVAQDQRSERFGDHHGEENPQLGGTHRAGSLNHARINRDHILLHNARNSEGCAEGHREDRRVYA